MDDQYISNQTLRVMFCSSWFNGKKTCYSLIIRSRYQITNYYYKKQFTLYRHWITDVSSLYNIGQIHQLFNKIKSWFFCILSIRGVY